MPPNDSDSSDDEAEGYTTTKVLLGYASTEPTDDLFSRIGGLPTWLDPVGRPNAQLAKCKVCSSMMTLLLQLNGDLPDRFPGHERRLYIFACRAKSCRRKDGSIRGIRAVRVSKTASGGNKKKTKKEEAPPKPVHLNLGNSIFGSKPPSSSGNASTTPFSITSTTQHFNPFSSSAHIASKPAQQPSEEDSLPMTFAQKVQISAPPAPSRPPSPWPEDSALPPPYPSFYLDAEYETLDVRSPSLSHSHHAQFDSTPSSSTNDPAEEAGAYESSLDKTFHRFADRLAQNPLQVLRYEFDGSPLLYSKTDS
ncbi:hypothetical protein MMC31_002351, partial [Peltigera leucophlebia]|nr:hypothetical protein [Peltigera leucophlebia]